MKIVGLTRQGCWTILGLSLVVVLLGDVGMYHSFAPNAESIPFLALIMLCLLRLMWREPRKQK